MCNASLLSSLSHGDKPYSDLRLLRRSITQSFHARLVSILQGLNQK